MNNANDTTPPTNPRSAIIFGMVVVLLGFGTFAAWASVAQLSSAIIGAGTVKVLSDRKTVQSLEGGKVEAINVHNGQVVTVGDVLIRLDDTSARASLDVVQSSYDLAAATVARLQAERDGRDDIDFPADLIVRRSDPNVADILQSQRQLFDARRQALVGQTNVVREQVNRLDQQVNGLMAQSRAEADQIAISTLEHADMSKLLENKLVTRSRVLQLEREAAQLRGNKGDHDAQIAAAQAQIAEANLQMLQLRMNFMQDVNDKLGAKKAELFTLNQKLLDARHTLEQTTIRATENGTVVALNVHTVGGVIEPGAKLLEIVPAGDNLVIEAQIRPVDIDNVATGLEAEIVFPGLSRREMPRLVGEVTYVSADALTDQRTGAPYFVAKISLSDAEFEKLKTGQLLPGMPAEVFIKTGARTPLAYLTEPLRDSLSHAWREP